MHCLSAWQFIGLRLLVDRMDYIDAMDTTKTEETVICDNILPDFMR